jgi:hypothetical protein
MTFHVIERFRTARLVTPDKRLVFRHSIHLDKYSLTDNWDD